MNLYVYKCVTELCAHWSEESQLASQQRQEISLFCTTSRWSRNYPASYSMGTRGKVAGVWTGAFTSICSQDYECIQLHCHHYPYIFVAACQWFYHWLAISTVQFLVCASIFPSSKFIRSHSKKCGSSGVITVPWVVNSYKCFGGMYCLCLHDLAVQKVLTARLSVWRQ